MLIRRVLAATLLVSVGIAVPSPLTACGDKYLLPPRGMTFDQAYRALHPGSIVIYAPMGSPAKPGEYAKVQAMLTRAGHRVTLVQDPLQISQALAAGKTDVILVSFSEAGPISARLTGGRNAATILPVFTKPTKADVTACRLKFACDLKATDRPEEFVLAVNGAMNIRAKTAQKPVS